VTDPDPAVRANAAFSLGQIGDAAGIPALLQFANDRDNADVAAEAVEALSKLAPRVTLAQYAPYTNDPREGVKARAIEFLFRFKSDEASALAAAALESPSPIIRQMGAYALARRAYAPARAKLELLLTDAATQTRANAAAALGRIGSKESLPPLLAALQDAHPWVRTNAVVAIGRIAAADPHALDGTDVVRDSVKVIALIDDPDPGTRASAIDTLGRYAARDSGANRRLHDVYTTGSRWDREIAAGAIARNDPDDARRLEGLTPWAMVRILEALNDSALSQSIRAAYATNSDPLVRATAIRTIPDTTVDPEEKIIRAAVDDPDVIVRGYAIDRYAHLKDHDRNVIRAAELRARRDPQNDARLSAITSIDDEALLRGLLTDNDPVVRRVAADQIENKLHKPRPQFTPLPVTNDYAAIVRWAREPHNATIHMTRGNIEIKLLTQDAPITAWNFARLAEKHYFDNTTFMRVVPNFVIQGGDPRNDMEGSPGYAIRDEINLQKYTRGAVGMALSGPDTGGSQFFITHSPQPHLDGGYTIFGRVTEGMNAVVDETERGDRVETITIH
jgi:cyclophilin family peptidyl-prolyl cis-trans isomerase/HEAT repeat protein